MLAAVPISTLFLLATPFVGAHLPTALRLYAVVACVVLFTISFNVAADPYQALMADITPESQRGRVMGVWMLIGVIGQASLVLLPMAPERKFAVAGLAMLVTTLLTCAATTEPKLPPDPGRLSHTDQMRRAVEGLSTLKQAKRLIVVLFFSGVGIGAVLPFLTVFVKAITGCTDHAAELMFLVLLASTGVALPPFGWMTDRAGPKPVLLCGMALVGIAAVSATWLHVYWQIGVDLAVAGLGNAAISASAYPLLTAVVPAAEVGFYTGLQSAASSIAQPLTAVVTGMLVNRGGYRLIFVVCGVSVIAGGLILLGVRVERARAEVATLDKLHGREA
jgi:MFS family permease